MEEEKIVKEPVNLTYEKAATIVAMLKKEVLSEESIKLDTPEKRALVYDSLTFMENEIASEKEYHDALEASMMQQFEHFTGTDE